MSLRRSDDLRGRGRITADRRHEPAALVAGRLLAPVHVDGDPVPAFGEVAREGAAVVLRGIVRGSGHRRRHGSRPERLRRGVHVIERGLLLVLVSLVSLVPVVGPVVVARIVRWQLLGARLLRTQPGLDPCGACGLRSGGRSRISALLSAGPQIHRFREDHEGERRGDHDDSREEHTDRHLSGFTVLAGPLPQLTDMCAQSPHQSSLRRVVAARRRGAVRSPPPSRASRRADRALGPMFGTLTAGGRRCAARCSRPRPGMRRSASRRCG